MDKRFAAALSAFALMGQTPPTLSVPPVSAVVSYSAPVIAIEHVRLIDGTLAAPREDQTVVIAHGRIASVGSASSATIPGGAKVIDARGYSLTPGFVGTHNHLYYVSDDGPMFIMREQPYSAPRLYLAGGVTTIRTTGSVEPYTDLRIKAEVDAGHLAGPHIDVTSVYMTGYEPFFLQMGTLRSPADARETVDFWARRGVTSFKLYTNIPPDIAQAVVDAAHARHLKVLAHLCSIGFTQAAQMGVDSLEHGILVDTEFTPGKNDDHCPRLPLRCVNRSRTWTSTGAKLARSFARWSHTTSRSVRRWRISRDRFHRRCALSSVCSTCSIARA